MGPIFEAVRQHMPQFQDEVDPVALMAELMSHLSRRDSVGAHLLESVFLFAYVARIVCTIFRDVVLETAVLVSRALKTSLMRSWS